MYPVPKTGNVQNSGVYQNGRINFDAVGTQMAPSIAMSTTGQQPPSSTFPGNQGVLNCQPNYYIQTLQGGSVQFLDRWTQNVQSMPMTSSQTLRPLPTLPYCESQQRQCNQVLAGSTGNFTAYQLHNTGSGLPQGETQASAQAIQKHGDKALQKRELYLMKNREAAQKYRRKKSEYVRCLENRLAELEKQNKALTEEFAALKNVNRHKAQ